MEYRDFRQLVVNLYIHQKEVKIHNKNNLYLSIFVQCFFFLAIYTFDDEGILISNFYCPIPYARWSLTHVMPLDLAIPTENI